MKVLLADDIDLFSETDLIEWQAPAFRIGVGGYCSQQGSEQSTSHQLPMECIYSGTLALQAILLTSGDRYKDAKNARVFHGKQSNQIA